jgi:hypothetical protein
MYAGDMVDGVSSATRSRVDQTRTPPPALGNKLGQAKEMDG